MYPILFKFAGLSIYSYGLMAAIGFMVGIWLTLRYAKREGIREDYILDLAIYVVIAAIVGARMLYVIGQWGYYSANPAEILMIQNGGLVALGGVLLDLLVISLYARWKKIPLLRLYDTIVPGTALGYSIGRIGCLLNGCCFGLPTNLPWGITFPKGSLADTYFPCQHLHPTQIYSVILMFLAFWILVFVYRSKRYDGQIFFWWLLLYASYRFGVELFRFSPIHWLGLTPSQWIVVGPLFVAAFILFKHRQSK